MATVAHADSAHLFKGKLPVSMFGAVNRHVSEGLVNSAHCNNWSPVARTIPAVFEGSK